MLKVNSDGRRQRGEEKRGSADFREEGRSKWHHLNVHMAIFQTVFVGNLHTFSTLSQGGKRPRFRILSMIFCVVFIVWAITDPSELCFLLSSNICSAVPLSPHLPFNIIFFAIIIKSFFSASLHLFFFHSTDVKEEKETKCSPIGQRRQHPQLSLITLHGLHVANWVW